jgi:hypothetical protein
MSKEKAVALVPAILNLGLKILSKTFGSQEKNTFINTGFYSLTVTEESHLQLQFVDGRLQS